jgi:hypothetical protein
MADNASWIRACQSPVVPGTSIHAMALTPLVLWTVWWSWWTFLLTLGVAVLFITLEVKGRRPQWVVARLRSKLRGQKVLARPYWYTRRRSRIESYADLRIAQAWDGPSMASPSLMPTQREGAAKES